jgi:Peptidase family M48
MTPEERAEDSETFRRATAHRGAPLPDDMHPQVRATYYSIAARAEDLIKRARKARGLPPIHFDFIVNPQINAFAFRAADRYFIGINTGTIYMLRMVIGRMLSDPRVFSFIGEPSKEDEKLEPIKHYAPNADEMVRTYQLTTPRDDIRALYASHLEDQAIMFFVGHEIAHISRGHVDYLLHQRSVLQAAELSNDAISDELQLERQSLEQDADRRSIQSRIISLKMTHSDVEYTGVPWAPSNKGAGLMIRDWSVSLSILFRLFGDARFVGSKLGSASYPPLPIRHRYAKICASWGIANHWDADLSTVGSAAIENGHYEAEKAFATILGQPMSMEGYKQAMSQENVDHMKRLQAYWNSTLVGKLRPYSYEF